MGRASPNWLKSWAWTKAAPPAWFPRWLRYGYAEKDEVTRRYHPGPQVVSLSRSVLTRLPLREAAKPFLRQLMERTGECAHLAVPAQGKVLYIDQVESPATLRVNAEVGTMNPLHCTALGKALLAFGDLAMPAELERYTANTIRNKRTPGTPPGAGPPGWIRRG